MNAIDMLKAQHRQVEKLFAALKAARGNDKRQLFYELADMLAIHTAIEERHFYPGVKASDTQEILIESLEEHLEAKRTLADLLELDIDDGAFEQKVFLLEEQVSHHVEEEEEQLFPQVQKLLDRDQLEGIGQEMTATASELADKEPRRQIPAEVESAATLH
jgi:hemerythrin superfamily protein